MVVVVATHKVYPTVHATVRGSTGDLIEQQDFEGHQRGDLLARQLREIEPSLEFTIELKCVMYRCSCHIGLPADKAKAADMFARARTHIIPTPISISILAAAIPRPQQIYALHRTGLCLCSH